MSIFVRRSALAATCVAALFLSACSNSTPSSPASSSAATSADANSTGASGTETQDPALKMFYEQQVQWTECADAKAMTCATVKVPMDYAHPDNGKTVSLALIRRTADNTPAGDILMNPGGPGGSGYNQVRDSVTLSTSAALREKYSMVGFDPRGVGKSQGVTCLSDAELDKYYAADVDPSTDAGLAQYEAATKAYAQACEKNTGELLQYVDTGSSAKDMDIIRAAAFKAPKLNYLGFSYGTYLGNTYAQLFPKNVGKFTLDAALAPSLNINEVSEGQAAGFEENVRKYVENCLQQGTCPLRGDVDGALAELQQFLKNLEAKPLRTSDPSRPLTQSLAVSAVLLPMYSSGNWPTLTQALSAAFNGDGSGLLQLADYANSRDANGKYDGSSASFTAINCVDYPRGDGNVEKMRAESEKLKKASPTFGGFFGYSDVSCASWPAKAVTKREAMPAEGAGPILVVGTKHDPATPYAWAELMASQIESAYLITWTGYGHTAYSRSACVTQMVDAYYLLDKLPEAGATCTDSDV